MAQPIPHTRGMAPMGAGGETLEREPARTPSRSSARMYRAPEAFEKYEVYPEEIPEGMDLQWLPTKIAGAPNPKVGQYYRAGWMPAKSEDFPRISGFGTEFPEAMIAAGLLENVKGEAPIVIDDQMLVMRRKEVSRRAEHERINEARSQVDNQMRRLQQASRAFRGTEIRRQHAPMPDQPRADIDYEE